MEEYDNGGALESDPLFTGLTRPAMIMGVHFMLFLMNMMLTMVIFINTKNLAAILVLFPVLHASAYLACLKEPRMIELVIMRYGNFSKCRNRIFHNHTNSYDL